VTINSRTQNDHASGRLCIQYVYTAFSTFVLLGTYLAAYEAYVLPSSLAGLSMLLDWSVTMADWLLCSSAATATILGLSPVGHVW
jgi:hypothetical protein